MSGLMDSSIKAIFIIIISQGRVHSPGQMEAAISDRFWMEKDKDKGSTIVLKMDLSTKGNGKTGIDKEKEF